MKTLNYILATAAIIGLAGCQTERLGTDAFMNDPNAVRISATVGEPLTRSNPVGDATTVKQFNAGDKMYVSSNSLSAVYEFDGTSWSPVIPDQYLTWDSAKQNFTAYYPDTYRGSGNVPQDQSNDKKISAADYMKFEGDLEMQETVSFTMSRQTARVIIRNDFSWNDEYMEGVVATHKVDAIMVNCIGVSDIKPYQSGNYYALVNSGSADPDATFLTITVSPIDGQGPSVTHTVRGIPEFESGYSYEYDITIGKSGVTISDVTVEDWSTGSILGGEGSADDNVEPYFHVMKPEGNYTYAGGSKEYTIRSFITNGNGEQIGIPWIARFVRKLEDGTYEEIKQGDADYPDWITGFVDTGIGSTPDQKVSITVEPAEISNNHYISLRNNSPVNGLYNLSNASGGETVENTANCYIINAAGTYSFPLVYGNAIKNGTDNPSAYKSGLVNNNYALESFVNHNNEPITSPYIAEHSGCVPNNATLVWQDADNLVSNIQFVDGGSPEAHRITFDVDQSTLKQGNAIIAVRNSDNIILWSWHIWVTDYKPGLESTIMANYDPTVTQRDKKVWSFDNQHSFVIMGVPMGWCDAESAAGRETIIQYIQAETGDTYELTIKQEPLSAGGNYVYYQWGRKDPMLGSDGFKYDKPYYASDYPFTKDGPGKATVGKTIQNPHIFYNWADAYHREWCDNAGTAGTQKSFLYNLWDATNATASATDKKYTIPVKTVYDPSPVGYVVPPNGAMNGMTYNAKNILNNWAQFNTPFTTMEEFSTNKGMVFYCKGMNSKSGVWNADGGVIYYPAVGRRFEDGSLYEIGEAANYWTATPHDAARMWMSGFSFTNNEPGVGAMTYYGTVYGEALRPVRE